MDEIYEDMGQKFYKNDEAVDSPVHYQGKGMESIDVIESFDLGFRLGNTVKYVLRAGKKDSALQDLMKARWYLEREIHARKEETKTGDSKPRPEPSPY